MRTTRTSIAHYRRIAFALAAFLAGLTLGHAQTVSQTARQPVSSGKRYKSLAIRNALVIDGNGTPAAGPKDILIEGNLIRAIVPLDPVALSSGEQKRPEAEAEIDAAGKYVLPGLINAHVHVQDERGGVPQPLDYELKLWLSCGITSVRDVGSDLKKTLQLREKSNSGEVAAPRVFVYGRFDSPAAPVNASEARRRVRELKQSGVDGIKIFAIDRDILAAMSGEAHELGLRIAHHAAVAESNAWDDIRFGITSIEHWYGVPDAAIERGVQDFPASYNYNNETDRFRYAGRLFREADPERLAKVLEGMVRAGVAWVPTLDIYEASRDLVRAQNQPWFRDYLHPTLEEYFRPNPQHHGSYFIGWTSTDETFWKENYRLWMAALLDFGRRGGLIGVGDDAGFIYQMYGFGMLREMELQQEAGFHPIRVIQHATGNNARILGEEERLGRIRPGFLADLIVVDGNPLADLKVLYPTGVEMVRDGKVVRTGGVQWTIKDGIPYHAPTMLSEVGKMVAQARASHQPAR